MRSKRRGEERNRSGEGRKRRRNEDPAKKLESNRRGHKPRERETEERLGSETQKGRRSKGRGGEEMK